MCFLRKKYDKARSSWANNIKMSLIKFHYDIARPQNSENFYGIWVFMETVEQNNSKLDKMSKPTLELIRLFVNAYKNGINYHSGFCWQKMIALFFKKRRMIFLLSQQGKILLNSNVGAFKSFLFFGRKQSEENFIIRFFKKVDWCLLFC